MNLSEFSVKEINGCSCYESGEFIIVQNIEGKWNAYQNGSSVQKIILRQEDDGEGGLVNVLGAKEYSTPEEAAIDCGA